MKNKKLGRTIFSLFVVTVLLVLGFIMGSDILKTDTEYWIVFIIMMITCVVSLPVLIRMGRKNILEAEEKRVKKMIDENNENKYDEK